MEDRFDVSDFVSQVDEGMKTTSTFTISNITGYDSNIVKCISKYQGNAVFTSVSVAVLSVLGKSESWDKFVVFCSFGISLFVVSF